MTSLSSGVAMCITRLQLDGGFVILDVNNRGHSIRGFNGTPAIYLQPHAALQVSQSECTTAALVR